MSRHKGFHAGKAKTSVGQKVVIVVAVLVIVVSMGVIGMAATGGLGFGSVPAASNESQGQPVASSNTNDEGSTNQNEVSAANALENASVNDEMPTNKSVAADGDVPENVDAANETPDNQPDTQSQKALTTDSPSQQSSAAIEQYRKIVAGATSMSPFEDGDSITGSYQYAAVSMQQGEGPTLLLAQQAGSGAYLARVYYYDEASGTLYDTGSSYDASEFNSDTKAYLQFGVGSGGFRGDISLEHDGNGLMVTEWASGTGEGDTMRCTRNGNALAYSAEESFSMRNGDEVPAGKEIQWFDVSDTSGLDGWSV